MHPKGLFLAPSPTIPEAEKAIRIAIPVLGLVEVLVRCFHLRHGTAVNG